MLYIVYIIFQVKTSLIVPFEEFQFDKEGFFHHSYDYGVTIIIPKDAVNTPSTLQFGVTTLIADFNCEDSLEPVSPFVWIHTDTELTKPAQLYISHHVIVENNEDRKNVCLLTRGDNQSVFRVNDDLSLEINETFAKVSGTHFCSACLADNPVPTKRYEIMLAKRGFKGGVHECDVCIVYCKNDIKVCHYNLYLLINIIPIPCRHLKSSMKVME